MKNMIYLHPVSKGELWQGGYEDVINLEFDPAHTDLVILAARDFQGKVWAPNNIQVIRIPFDDCTGLTEGDIKTISKMVDGASTWAAKYIREGKRVLSTCAAGINRSSLVTAATLIKLDPKFTVNPDLAIETIRASRYGTLSNPQFVEMIRSWGVS